MNFWTEKRLNRLTIFLAVILLFILASNFIPVGYFVTAPGLAIPLDEIIEVRKGEKDAVGAFYLTSVTEQEAKLFNYLYIRLLKPRGLELSPKEVSMPEGIDEERYIKIMEDMMSESQLFAKYNALKLLGYKTEITGDGAEIVEVMEESKAKDLLQSGDIIVAIEGKAVRLASEAVNLIQQHAVGDIIPIQVKRKKEWKDLQIPTMEMKEAPGKASIGIYIMTHNREYHFPVEVDIAAKNIVGPSAGTMFTLEIINQLDPEDLTRGYKIAGTGTVDMDGKVGPIDGVMQKVLAAEREGAEYFLAPEDNYADAVKAATQLKVIKVKTVEEALQFLRGLTPKK